MSDNKKEVNALEAGVVGAIIGAAATAVAVLLSDEKNRKKAEKVLNNLENRGDKIIKEISRKAMELKDQVNSEEQPEVKELQEVKKSIKKVIKES